MPISHIPHDGAFLGSQGSSERFHFAVISDTHTHRTPHPAEQSETTLMVIEELNLLRPDFVLHAGDLIRGYTDDEPRLRVEHEGAKRELSRLEMPFYPCVGNHDVREEISDRVWHEFWGGKYYSFDWADCHFITLDAETDKDSESIAGPQLEWLKKDLAENADSKRVFVTLHRPWWYDYPLHTAEWKQPGGRNDWNDIVDPVLRGRNLQAIFSGHRHQFEVDHRNGVPHIVAGGAGGDVKVAPEEGGMSHYLWVTVDPDRITWSVIVPGQIMSPERVRPLERLANGRPNPVLTPDFTQEMPWLLHPAAARSGWHHEREKAEAAPQPKGLKGLLGRLFG